MKKTYERMVDLGDEVPRKEPEKRERPVLRKRLRTDSPIKSKRRRGFFPTEKKKKDESKNKSVDYSCETCGLNKNCNSPLMPYRGQGKKEILLIGEAPGDTEDNFNEQFVGRSGEFLKNQLEKFGIDMNADCYKQNVVRCHPIGDRKPTRKELRCCWRLLEKDIKELKPKFIVLIGGKAIEAFFMDRFTDLTISRWRGLCIPDQDRFNAWVLPIFHPAYIIRNLDDDSLISTWERDLKFLVSCFKKEDRPKKQLLDGSLGPSYLETFTQEVETLFDPDKIISALKDVMSAETIAFDYETTSLTPFSKEQKIWSISCAWEQKSKVRAISFAINHPTIDYGFKREKIIENWKSILKNPFIKKVAHNLKFEDIWSRECFGLKEVGGWHWCTMTTAHILDSRKSFTGLKFQSYIKFGIMPYDEAVKAYIAPRPGENINRLDQVPIEDLLFYGGLDARTTLALYNRQRKELRQTDRRLAANSFFLEGLKTLADVQMNGIVIDPEYYQRTTEKITTNISAIEREIRRSEEAKKFEKELDRKFDVKKKDYSTKDLREMFYKILGLEATKRTAKGFDSVDKESLERIKNSLAKKIIKRRRLMKIRDTYLEQFTKTSGQKKIHPFLDLHNVASFRSSSSRPNLQNQPKRDEEAAQYIRSGFYPHPGQRFLEADYSSLEVRIIACASKDPRLIEYIKDPTTDMHRDQAEALFFLDEKQMTKDLRFHAKNSFVFAQFYGSSFKPCAANLWRNCLDLKIGDGTPLKTHLIQNGVSDFKDWVEHIENCEKGFWSEFDVIREWQKELIDRYRVTGYVEMFFGFRRSGYLSENQIINSPIQGSAFHLLLFAMIEINKQFKLLGLKSKVMFEIHDSIGISVEPSEMATVINLLQECMIEKPKKTFDWLCVPLDIEVEAGGVNQSWYSIKKIPHKRYLKK